MLTVNDGPGDLRAKVKTRTRAKLDRSLLANKLTTENRVSAKLNLMRWYGVAEKNLDYDE